MIVLSGPDHPSWDEGSELLLLKVGQPLNVMLGQHYSYMYFHHHQLSCISIKILNYLLLA
jgi:hypothetical protein